MKYVVGDAASSGIRRLIGRLAHSAQNKDGYPLHCSVLPPPSGGRQWGGTLRTQSGAKPVTLILFEDGYEPTAVDPEVCTTILVRSTPNAFFFQTTQKGASPRITVVRGNSKRTTLRKAEEYLFNQALID